MQAQTPQQRRANAAFARSEEKKMGRPEKTTVKKEKKEKPPISPFWVCTSRPIHNPYRTLQLVYKSEGANGW